MLKPTLLHTLIAVPKAKRQRSVRHVDARLCGERSVELSDPNHCAYYIREYSQREQSVDKEHQVHCDRRSADDQRVGAGCFIGKDHSFCAMSYTRTVCYYRKSGQLF